MPILPCQAAFGMTRGQQIQTAVEQVTGEQCPCLQMQVCPLFNISAAREVVELATVG